jgi:drug/metabolite transporter (DMT)-like permease
MGIRFTLTTVIFCILFRKDLPKMSRKDLVYGSILGVYLFLGFVPQTVGMKFTTASNSAFITGIYLVLVPVIQFIVRKEAPRKENVIGISIVLAGLFFLTGAHMAVFNIGDYLTLACAIAFAFHIFYLDVYSSERKADYRALVLGQFAVVTVLSIVFGILFEVIIFKDFFFIFNFELISTSFFNAIVATLIGLIIVNKYQMYTTPVRAGIIYSMEQVFAVIAAYFILNEVMNASQVAGALIMLAGLFISEFYGLIKSKSNEGTR